MVCGFGIGDYDVTVVYLDPMNYQVWSINYSAMGITLPQDFENGIAGLLAVSYMDNDWVCFSIAVFLEQ